MTHSNQGKTDYPHYDLHSFKLEYFGNFSINLRKEMADGLRIYFDFLLQDYLLYKPERGQASFLLSPENIKNFTYVGSEKLYVNVH